MSPSKRAKRTFSKSPEKLNGLLARSPLVILPMFCWFLLILESCAPTRPRLPYPLSDKTVVSTDGHLRLHVPDGWFVPEGGDSFPGLLVWLVKEDYSATMGLMEIKADERLRKEVKAAGLRALGRLSFSLKQGREPSAELLSGPEVFRLRRRNFCSFEYTSDDGATVIRTVVFDTGKGFYELTVVPNASNLPGATQPIFDAQEAILYTIKW